MSRSEWLEASDTVKKMLFRHSSIHVYGGRPKDVGGVLGWHAESLNAVVDIYQTLQCQGDAIYVQMMPQLTVRPFAKIMHGSIKPKSPT